MTEHPYKPQPWRLTEYYPEAYARFMDALDRLPRTKENS